MKNKFAIVLLTLTFTASTWAQHTLVYNHQDALFNQGKEYILQKNYAASTSCFQEFIRSAKPTQTAQIQDARFFIASNSYQLHQPIAKDLLTEYLDKHPYSPYSDRTNYMLGMINYERKNYGKALPLFLKINTSQLENSEKMDILFCKGYCYLQTKDYSQASTCFKELKSYGSKYDLSASYYYAYAEYINKNYDAALPEFKKLEETETYKGIVPYYIIQIYYSKSEYDLIKEKASRLLVSYPTNKNNPELYRILGEIAYQERSYDDAIGYLKNYEKIFKPVLRNDIYLLGLSYFQTKDYENAVRYLSKVTTVSDEMTENAYLHLGNSYVKLKDLINARMAYESATKTNFNTEVREEALFNYALTTFQTITAFGESISAFELFLTEYPKSKYIEKAFDYLSSAYMTTKNYDDALASLSKIEKPNAKLIETKQYLLFQLGAEAFWQKKMDKAIKHFSQSLWSANTGKYSAECYFWRGEAYYRTGQYEKSVTDFHNFFKNRNAQKSENYVLAHYSLGYGYFSQKQYDAALEWFLKYIELEKKTSENTYTDALNRAGDCYFSARNLEQAEELYSKAGSINPDMADYAMFQSAYVAGLRKDYKGKISKLENMLATFPKSQYKPNAYYEMGRAYLMLDDNAKAIAEYKILLDSMPTSDLARKAALEIGMTYFNGNNFEQAITAYKDVLAKYSGSEESYTALSGLESAYIETNDIPAYLAYVKTLNLKIVKADKNHEDSITYIAAEKQYLNGKYIQAITGLKTYLNNYCKGGKYCTTVHFYLADSYYHTDQKDSALATYKQLLAITPNQYAEEANLRCAEISFDNKNYAEALPYFKQLQATAQNEENKNVGRLGILRCSNNLKDNQTTVNVVAEIMKDPRANADTKIEARYNRAKAFLAMNDTLKAQADLDTLALDTRTANGAEAKYLKAKLLFDLKKYTEAEAEVQDFAQKNTPHQFWLAKSFVLLADIYIKQENDFQAKQYLLSLQRNYTEADEIQTLITERLNAIAEREKQAIIQ
jgi:tetratricopeptide (TPR) repeat protein